MHRLIFAYLRLMLFTSSIRKKSEFPVRFFGFVTVYRGLLCTHWKFKKKEFWLSPAIWWNCGALIVWICKVNFRDPKQFILHVCERVRDRNERKWWVYRNCLFMPDSSWADPEGDRPHPWKIGFLSILVRFPLKSQSYQASIRCWAISGTPAKRHLNGVSLAGQWWPAYSGVWILSPIIN